MPTATGSSVSRPLLHLYSLDSHICSCYYYSVVECSFLPECRQEGLCGGDRYQFAVEDTRDFSACNSRDRQRPSGATITTTKQPTLSSITSMKLAANNDFFFKRRPVSFLAWKVRILTLFLALRTLNFLTNDAEIGQVTPRVSGAKNDL